MIEVQDLCFDYPGKRAVDHVSINISPNTITALVGPNGAGKTSLLRCLCALELPLHGTVKINGYQTDRFPRKVHQVCSYLSDFYGLYEQLTVRQNLSYAAWSHHCTDNINALVEKTAKRLALWQYIDSQAAKLSRGLRQRLAIGQTIIHQPKVLLLDEPAAGLDPEARFNLSQLLLQLQSEGMTIIVSSHILSELEDYSSHMIVLQEGQLVKQCTLGDTPSSNLNKRILKLELTKDASLYVDLLKSIPNLQVLSSQANTVILAFEGDVQSQQQLLKTLIEKDIPVLSIQEQKQNMQDIYMSVSRELKAQSEAKDKSKKE